MLLGCLHSIAILPRLPKEPFKSAHKRDGKKTQTKQDKMAFRSTISVCRPTTSTRTIPSFGFSGAGFLACYHLGAAKCFLEHGYLNFESLTKNTESDPRPRLTGVSGGALMAAAVAAGVDPEVGMQTTLNVAQRTRQEGGLLDTFRPGYVV